LRATLSWWRQLNSVFLGMRGFPGPAAWASSFSIYFPVHLNRLAGTGLDAGYGSCPKTAAMNEN